MLTFFSKNYRQFVTIKKQSIMPLIRSQLTKKEYVLLKAILLCNAGNCSLFYSKYQYF